MFVACLAGVLWTQSAFAQSNPKVIEIQIPDPTPPPLPPAPAPTTAPAPNPYGEPAGAEPGVAPADGLVASAVGTPRNATRRAVREVAGETPATLWGRYRVVDLTEGGETEDFATKMQRAGNALDQDCIVERLVFDFGPATDPGLPNVLLLSEQSLCKKGGLGTYANELAVALPATWSASEGGLVMTLPPVDGTASLVRLRKPEADNLHTPPHWQGPEIRINRPETKFVVLAEFPKKKPVGQPATVVHLRAGNVVYHLEPEPADGPFGR